MGSPIHAASSNGNNENRNDLTNIRGIGVSRKRWLNSVGIHTIADLSQASVDEIESQLKSNGRLLSRSELEEWIAQAQAVDTQNQQPEAVHNSSETLSETELATSSTDWNPIAVFKVEYQTRQTPEKLERRTLIHHLETNASENWQGFETQLIQRWMLDSIETTLPQLKTENPIVLNIAQLQVIQPHQTGQPMIADHTHPLFPSAIPINKPFALEVSMQLTGLSDPNLQKHMPCNVQCTVHDVLTGATTRLGEVTVNVPPTNHTTYKAWLPELTLSRAGIYRLKVLATLQSQAANLPAVLGYFKVPMLQVV
ncbi:MAG: hypothetical protein HC827_10420 [Cyanobacteria bacterium RM1_2_2]|nr:hypothetical protein [Cyanobacteria bacterium RM1_2_2]